MFLHVLGMSQVEELLISCACPIMTVYHTHGGQLGYSGHVFKPTSKYSTLFINKLAIKINDLPVLTVLQQGQENTYRSFRVCRGEVLNTK